MDILNEKTTFPSLLTAANCSGLNPPIAFGGSHAANPAEPTHSGPIKPTPIQLEGSGNAKTAHVQLLNKNGQA